MLSEILTIPGRSRLAPPTPGINMGTLYAHLYACMYICIHVCVPAYRPDMETSVFFPFPPPGF